MRLYDDASGSTLEEEGQEGARKGQNEAALVRGRVRLPLLFSFAYLTFWEKESASTDV